MKLRTDHLPSRLALSIFAGLSCVDLAWSHQAIDPGIIINLPGRGKKCVFPIGTPPSAECIELGRRLFESETFGGNGRTCATCHPASNNFTIDVPFIKSRPPTDPLFVAEFNPLLANLELPALPGKKSVLRSKGLICENLDGFDKPCVLRSVPHILGLRLSVSPDVLGPFNAGRPLFPLVNALGWSGDGSPGDGSLRNFAVGAIVQHFPKTLSRTPGLDFRMPTADELDALEAFQLSLGRQEELNLDPKLTNTVVGGVFSFGTPALPSGLLQFTDIDVANGQKLFFGGAPSKGTPNVRSCSGCHVQAGAGSPFAANTSPPAANRNRATGVEFSPLSPPCLPNGANVVNGDGGFGQGTGVVISTNFNKSPPNNSDPVDQGGVETILRTDLCGFAGQDITYIGTRFFNTPSVIEAASTIPSFHNNISETVEEAVLFYTTDTFNNSIAGAGRAFLLGDQLTSGNVNSVMVRQIGAFMRAINALDSQSSAAKHLSAAINSTGQAKARNVSLAIRKIEDAIGVLTKGGPSTTNRLGGPMNLFTSEVIANFTAAKKQLQVMGKSDLAYTSLKSTQLAAAQTSLTSARNGMLQSSQ